jgi:hypothetical protein
VQQALCEDTALTNIDRHRDDDRFDVVKPGTNQLMDLGVDESMEDVYIRRGDFRNAERDRDEYSDGAATTASLIPTTRGERSGIGRKSTTSSMPKTPPDGDPDRHGYDDRFEYHQTQYQPADRPGSVDESMENVLHQRRSDFRNAERDRDEYSDGAATSSLIPRPPG